MKQIVISLLLLCCLGLVIQEKESKTQPKEVTLSKDSQSDKYGEVAFNHENHAVKKYSIDGQSVLTCVECHHTDQPAANLKAPLKTSERAVVLSTEALAVADAKPSKLKWIILGAVGVLALLFLLLMVLILFYLWRTGFAI